MTPGEWALEENRPYLEWSAVVISEWWRWTGSVTLPSTVHRGPFKAKASNTTWALNSTLEESVVTTDGVKKAGYGETSVIYAWKA